MKKEDRGIKVFITGTMMGTPVTVLSPAAMDSTARSIPAYRKIKK
jgi:hypothetical protein